MCSPDAYAVHAAFTTQGQYRRAGLGLLQDLHGLAVGERDVFIADFLIKEIPLNLTAG